MVKKDITYQDKLNELRLDIAHPNKRNQVFVLVEGESDIRLFRKLFNLNNCSVECIPGGNAKLEQCVDELCKVHSLLAGIRDSDFLSLSNTPYSKTNMFRTDYHDIELMLIFEDEVFSALCNECTNIGRLDHKKLRENIFKIIEDISYLKWLNDLENLELVFTPGFSDLISISTLSVDFDVYIRRVLGKSPNAKIRDEALLKSKIDSLKEKGPNVLFLCNGHDFIKTLSYFITSNGGAGISTVDAIAAAMRISYTINHFGKTELYLSIKSWSGAKSCSILN